MRPLTILLVEDEPVIALDLRMALEQHGHRVICAHDAGEALAFSARYLPDVAILNFLMQHNMDGMELAQLLRTRFLVRVLMVTGSRWEDMEASAQFYAGTEVLYKPFTRRQLKECLEDIVK
ncbi:MAG: response regulator [Lewinellaceae bacterium]|nr:response regulator [Saprospiraceae bacterium]MCB9337207.1 response regulator [Lewinellaceae bacterium]